MVADHLSRLIVEASEEEEINYAFPHEKILMVTSSMDEPWYADVVNYLSKGYIRDDYSKYMRRKLM